MDSSLHVNEHEFYSFCKKMITYSVHEHCTLSFFTYPLQSYLNKSKNFSQIPFSSSCSSSSTSGSSFFRLSVCNTNWTEKMSSFLYGSTKEIGSKSDLSYSSII